MVRGLQDSIDYFRARAIKQLILDCETFDLNEPQAIKYISGRLAIPSQVNSKKGKGKKTKKEDELISRSTYYKYKAELDDEKKDINKRMFNHAKEGFVKTHFEIIDGVTTVLRNLTSLLSATNNPVAKASLANTVLQYYAYLHQLNVSSPLIDSMKAFIDEKLKDEPTIDVPVGETPNVHDPIHPSACTLPEGFIKSSNITTNDGRGIPTGKESPNRVFEKARKSPPQALLDSGRTGP